MLVAQCREGSRGQTAAPVLLVMCGRLLDPAEFASAAGLVVDAEQLVSVEEGGSLAPASAWCHIPTVAERSPCTMTGFQGHASNRLIGRRSRASMGGQPPSITGHMRWTSHSRARAAALGAYRSASLPNARPSLPDSTCLCRSGRYALNHGLETASALGTPR